MKRLLTLTLCLITTGGTFNVLADTCDNLRNNQQAYRDCVNDWYGRSNRGSAPTPWWKNYDPNAGDARQESGDNDWQRQQSEYFQRRNEERQEQNRRLDEKKRQQSRRTNAINEAVAIYARGQEHYAAGRIEEALSAYRRALAIARENSYDPQNLATMSYGLGMAHLDLRQYTEAAALFRQVLATPSRRYKNESDEAVNTYLGQALMGSKQYVEAEALYRNLIPIIEQNPDLNLNYPSSGPALDDWTSAMDNWASALEQLGRHAEAEPHRKRAHDVLLKGVSYKRHSALKKLNANQEAQKRQEAGQRSYDEYLAINRMNELLYLKKYDQALTACDDAMRMAERHQSPDLLTLAQEQKADALIKLNRTGEAEALLTQALAKAEKSATAKEQTARMRASLATLRGPAEGERTASTPTSAQWLNEWQTLNEEAIRLYKAGQIAQAIEKGRQALALTEKNSPANHPNTISSRLNLATFLRADKQTDQADALFRQVLDDADRAKGTEALKVAKTLGEVASNYVQKLRHAEAEALYKRALAILDKTPGANDEQTAGILKGLAKVYRSSKREGEAEGLDQRAGKLLAGN